MENACFDETDTWDMLNYDNETCVDDNLMPLSTFSTLGASKGTLEANTSFNLMGWMIWAECLNLLMHYVGVRLASY